MQSQPLADIEADWPRLSGLLDEIMNLPPASRESFIGALPPPDDRLADTLRELLALQAKVETEAFMDDLPVFPGLLPEPLSGGAASALLSEGTEVGPYRLLRPIGEGGMGAVWLAERTDGTLKRKVALKLPRLAWAQDLAVRMARERDILAGLEHPNIARLYDAGVDAVGRPWLAIEYVEGRDLTLFCDTARLDLRARVRLFLQVLEAVQYAHGNLVIHRDLKPANILVTPRGEARLLDFGIARLEEGAVEAGPDLTRTGASAMTPRYASPEQVQGARLTVASDLYSLGVVLHELLTGETPYVLRRESRAEYEQAIVESDLRVPSRLKVTEVAAAARGTTPERIARDLRGDLDAVLLRALARAPAARYASAAAFRDDLERWLEGRTVTALPPSRLHSLRKFVARNRLAVAASAAAVLALVAVSVVAVLQAQRATRSAAEAQAEAARANATKDFLISTYAGADPTRRGGRDATAKELLIEAEKQLDAKLKGQPELQAEVLGTVERIWSLLGDSARSQAIADRRTEVLLRFGDRTGAAESLLKSAETALKLHDHTAVADRLTRIAALVEPAGMSTGFRARVALIRGALQSERGDRSAAVESLSQAIADSRTAGDQRTLFFSLIGRVFALRSSGDPVQLRKDIAEAEALVPVLEGERIDDLAYRLQVAVQRYVIGDYLGGWPDMQRIMQESDGLFGPDNPALFAERNYWIRYCLRLGYAGLVDEWLRAAEARGDRSVLREYGKDPQWRMLVSRVRMQEGDWRAAEAELDAAARLIDEALPDAQVTMDPLKAGISKLRAQLALRRMQPSTALRFAAEAAVFAARSGERPDDRYDRLWTVGVASKMESDWSRAVAELGRAETEAVSFLGATHPETALLRLDMALAAARAPADFDDARVAGFVLTAAPVLREALPSNHPTNALIDRLVGAAGSDGAIDERRLRRDLAAVPTSVFFL
jgi:serine/threonine protein kinase